MHRNHRLRNRSRQESWPVSLHLAHTKRISARMAAQPCSKSGLAETLARLAMNATAVSKRVQTDHVIAYCVINSVQTGLHALSLQYTSLYTCRPVQCRASPEMHQKEIKSMIAAEACNSWRGTRRLQNH
jgi:hypothetical protein